MKGQAKIDFEKWYLKCYEKENLPYIQGFNISSLSIKYGVYVDWFDSVDIQIDVYSNFDLDTGSFNDGYQFDIKGNSNLEIFKTRPEARLKAIKKAIEIHNNKEH